jgi:hypothetical protein
MNDLPWIHISFAETFILGVAGQRLQIAIFCYQLKACGRRRLCPAVHAVEFGIDCSTSVIDVIYLTVDCCPLDKT